jgi:NADH:ubiquinone oxidoreductase subunit F (NADH-binding)/NADH:ubiquinone oxidoreductase subunit E
VNGSVSASLPVLSLDRKLYGIYEELRAVQKKFGYIPKEEMHAVAARRGLPVRDIHAVATYYPHFLTEVPKRAEVAFCDDLSCHLNGSAEFRKKIENQFGEDERKELTFRTVSCLGRCDSPPALRINDTFVDGLSSDAVAAMIHKCLGGLPIESTAPIQYHSIINSDVYAGKDKYGCLRELVRTGDFAGVITKLKDAGLKGMGGAGFPASIKWELTRVTPATEKFVVCNADESEPGTLKDRHIMTQIPHMMIEGIIISALVVGAKRGWIYIRHEYEHAREVLQEELNSCYEHGLLGRNILNSGLSFELEIFVSPGGYICGEVGAMLEAMEGKRAEPRDKPPQTGTHGLWQKPTLASNVETFVAAVTILANGADWYKAKGKNGGVGLKFIAVSGHVNNPGAYEVPMGTSYSDIINLYGGGVSGKRNLFAFAPSGPSSGFLPASAVGLPMEWGALAKAGSMVGSSAVIACAEGTCMLDMALNAVRFFRNESCGKCVPCRVGTQKMVDMLTAWTQGHFSPEQMPLLEELSQMMQTASICGLGQIAPAPILSVIKHFPEQIAEHLQHQRCVGGVCFKN